MRYNMVSKTKAVGNNNEGSDEKILYFYSKTDIETARKSNKQA